MQKKTFQNAPKFSALQDLAVTIQTGSQAEILSHLLILKNSALFTGSAWQRDLSKLQSVFSGSGPAFSIFALGGNSKLPFVAFSTLPGVTCPGAGSCLEFCYSYRAWRYPAAFARMAQNAWLMRFDRFSISQAFDQIADSRPDGFDFRLYVDGDFASVGDLHFWMTHLQSAPQVRAYGYSKSLAIILGYDTAGHEWPTNYKLNLSSGHKYSAEMADYVRQLPIFRGDFVAVSVGQKVKSSDHGSAAINKLLRSAMPDQKIFPCPGTCGSCTGRGHACGMPELKNRVIAIAVH